MNFLLDLPAVLSFPLLALLVYILSRVATYAYFKSKQDYEQSKKKMES